jgi:hypothetical protein
MKPNAARYRKLSEPHATSAEAEEALQKFFNVVESAREEYRIPDLVVALSVNCMDDTGTEVKMFTDFEFGNEADWAEMAARAYGVLKERWTAKLMRAMKGCPA